MTINDDVIDEIDKTKSGVHTRKEKTQLPTLPQSAGGSPKATQSPASP